MSTARPRPGLNAYLQGLRATYAPRASGHDREAWLHGDVDDLGLAGMTAASPTVCARACLRFAASGMWPPISSAFWWLIMAIIKPLAERIFKRLCLERLSTKISPESSNWSFADTVALVIDGSAASRPGEGPASIRGTSGRPRNRHGGGSRS